MQEDPTYQIRQFAATDIPALSQFQVLMAQETQSLSLDQSLVTNALTYFCAHPLLGKFLLKVRKEANKQVPLGSLLITVQNPKEWWIQSVYVVPEERKKGHFTSLFKYAVQLAQKAHVSNIKLYVECQNLQARQIYSKLGMFVNGEKFYGYDLVYGKNATQWIPSPLYTLKKAEGTLATELEQQCKTSNQMKDILNHYNDGHNLVLACYKEDLIVGLCSFFTQFSEWRFGMTMYIDALYILVQEDTEKPWEILQTIMDHLRKSQDIKVGAMRFITKTEDCIKNIAREGHLEHYDVMEISLK